MLVLDTVLCILLFVVLLYDLVCQPLVTSYVIDAYLCLAMLHAWTLECVWWWIHMKAESQWLDGEDHQAALATSSSTWSRRMPTPYRYLRCGDPRSPGVMERRNGPLWLRDDNDDDDDDDDAPLSLIKWRLTNVSDWSINWLSLRTIPILSLYKTSIRSIQQWRCHMSTPYPVMLSRTGKTKPFCYYKKTRIFWRFRQKLLSQSRLTVRGKLLGTGCIVTRVWRHVDVINRHHSTCTNSDNRIVDHRRPTAHHHWTLTWQCYILAMNASSAEYNQLCDLRRAADTICPRPLQAVTT